MGTNADSRDSRPDTLSVNGRQLQPTNSNQSKAAEAAGFNHNQSIMATIADDDDRLLVRIGYAPVSTPNRQSEHADTFRRCSNDISQDGPLSHMRSPFLVYWAQFLLHLEVQ